MSLSPKYPNLELVEYKAKLGLSKDSIFNKRMKDKKKNSKYLYPEYEVEVFSQIWGSTCTGIDIDKFNNPVMAGNAMTKEYTTIVHEIVTDMYVVFFGDRPGYVVYDPTENFYEDKKIGTWQVKAKQL